jgi:rare lipoprotein A
MLKRAATGGEPLRFERRQDGDRHEALTLSHPASLRRPRPRTILRACLIGLGCLALANCASGPLKQARVKDPKYGVYASPRIVDGTGPIDPSISRRGVYMVGKPYVVAGKRYVPKESRDYTKVGAASWYGDDFHGRLTANGEVFDMHDITAAHATMPLPSYARVTNVRSGRSIVVRVNDRGPFHGGRIIDVSRRAAELLAFKQDGIGQVKVEYLGRAPTTVADESYLVATLRTDGGAAQLPAELGGSASTMVAALPDPAPQPLAEAAQPATPMLAAYTPAPAEEMGESFAAQEAKAFLAKVVLPPERPVEAGPAEVPAAVSPAEPAPALVPQAIPLPPQRSAMRDSDRLTIADIVGQGRRDAGPGAALAFMALNDPAAATPPALFVDAGSFAAEAQADTLRWVLSQAANVSLIRLDDAAGGGAVWRVQAGPFADRAEAEAVLSLARSAGASEASVVE